MAGEQIDMPGHRREIIDLGERRVEKKVAEQQFEQNAEIDERVGEQIEDDVMAFEKLCQPGGRGRESARAAPVPAAAASGRSLAGLLGGSQVGESLPRIATLSLSVCTARWRSAWSPWEKSRRSRFANKPASLARIANPAAKRAWPQDSARSARRRAPNPCNSKSRSN